MLSLKSNGDLPIVLLSLMKLRVLACGFTSRRPCRRHPGARNISTMSTMLEPHGELMGEMDP